MYRRHHFYRRNAEDRIPKEEAVPRLQAVKEKLGLSIGKMADALGLSKSQMTTLLFPRRSMKTLSLSIVLQAENLLQTMEPVRHRYAKPSKQEVLKALIDNDYKYGPTAKELGIVADTLKDLIDDYGIQMIETRIPVEEGAKRLRKVKDALGLSITQFGEALNVSHHRLTMFLYPSNAERAGYKNAPLDLIENAEGLLEILEPKRHRQAKPTKKQVKNALEASGYRRVKAANALGISPDTINELIKKYNIEVKTYVRDMGYGAVRMSDLTQKQKMRRMALNRAKRLSRTLYQTGKVYIGPVPGKGRIVKARHPYIAVAPRTFVTLDPRTNQLRFPQMPKKDYLLSDKTPLQILKTWKISLDEINNFLKSEELDYEVKDLEPLEVGTVYSSPHNYFLAFDYHSLLTIIDGEEFIQHEQSAADYQVEREIEMKTVVTYWNIDFPYLDKLIAKYFPRPKKEHKKKRQRGIPSFLKTEHRIPGRRIRRNPDEEIRRLERVYQADPTADNYARYQTALLRSGAIHYLHDCTGCILMHSEVGPSPVFSDHRLTPLDYYFCSSPSGGSLIIRYGDDGPQYTSYPVDIALSMYDHRDVENELPHLHTAMELARRLGHVPPLQARRNPRRIRKMVKPNKRKAKYIKIFSPDLFGPKRSYSWQELVDLKKYYFYDLGQYLLYPEFPSGCKECGSPSLERRQLHQNWCSKYRRP
jgi:transcriptional regulator with XRE-family HTH domain